MLLDVVLPGMAELPPRRERGAGTVSDSAPPTPTQCTERGGGVGGGGNNGIYFFIRDLGGSQAFQGLALEFFDFSTVHND